MQFLSRFVSAATLIPRGIYVAYLVLWAFAAFIFFGWPSEYISGRVVFRSGVVVFGAIPFIVFIIVLVMREFKNSDKF